MHTLFILGALILQLQVAPYKPAEEFKIELEYKFKPRPATDNAMIDLTETQKDKERRHAVGTPLPYLIVHLSFLQLSDKEFRVKCFDNHNKNKLSRKVELNKEYIIDLGYTDDMKDRITAYEFHVTLMSSDKEEASRIHLLVEKDGTFLVNGVMKGKF